MKFEGKNGEAQELCQRFVRRCRCSRCLRRAECEAMGEPCPPLAFALLSLKEEGLPAIKMACISASLNRFELSLAVPTKDNFELSLAVPTNSEEDDQNAVVTILVEVFARTLAGNYVYRRGRVPVRRGDTLNNLTIEVNYYVKRLGNRYYELEK